MADTMTLSLRLPVQTSDALKAEADFQGRTVNNLAAFVLRRFVAKTKARRELVAPREGT